MSQETVDDLLVSGNLSIHILTHELRPRPRLTGILESVLINIYIGVILARSLKSARKMEKKLKDFNGNIRPKKPKPEQNQSSIPPTWIQISYIFRMAPNIQF